MDVQMRDGLAGIRAGVGDDSKSRLGDAQLFSHRGGRAKQGSQRPVLKGTGLQQILRMRLGYYQHMHRRLGR